MHLQGDESQCQPSAAISYGFTCSSCTLLQTIESKPPTSHSLSDIQVPEETLNSDYQPLKSTGLTYPIGFIPGTFMPCIDLSDDDNACVAIDRICKSGGGERLEHGCEALLSAEYNLETSQQIAHLDSTRTCTEIPRSFHQKYLSCDRLPFDTQESADGLDCLQPTDQTAQDLDDLLPDTQQDVSDEPTSRILVPDGAQRLDQSLSPGTHQGPSGSKTQHFDALLPGTQYDLLNLSIPQIHDSYGQHDCLLPDTQRDPADSYVTYKSLQRTKQLDELPSGTRLDVRDPSTKKHLDDVFPDTLFSYPSPPPFLILDTYIAAESENIFDVSTFGTAHKLSCRERKRIIVPMNRPGNVTKAMKAWVAKTYYLLDPFREDDDCWLHLNPPPGRITPNGTLRPYGKIQKAFVWQDEKGKHRIVLNFGIVSKLLLNKMNKQQKDGFISNGFHLSHLCGNWTCLNPAHTTVEPGSVNASRNVCFSHRSGCGHSPPCMKDKKVFLDADGRQVDPTLPVPVREVEVSASQGSAWYIDWHEWGYEDDDVEDSTATYNVERSESMGLSLAKDNAGHDAGLMPAPISTTNSFSYTSTIRQI